MSEPLDERTQRIETIKQLICRLNAGEPAEEIRTQLREQVSHAEPRDIAEVEQQLIAEGTPIEELCSMCDLHAQLLHEIAAAPDQQRVAPGHPVDTFRRENEALHETLSRVRQTLAELRSAAAEDEPGFAQSLDRLRRAVNELADVDKHYQRKENLVFACLERHNITGPSRVMWAKDDEARQLLKRVHRVLADQRITRDEVLKLADTTLEPALEALDSMIFKEENVLWPMTLQTFDETDWARIWHDSPQYGWCLVEPREGYRPVEPAAGDSVDRAAPEELVFPTGRLTPKQLAGILGVLPVDVTFVDADDQVRYFSEGPERIFHRSKAILGRKVQHCHPPGSVHVVEKLLDDFRAGRQDSAQFWINVQERFVHIRYFAVRDHEGRYLGTLEVTQDLTPLRALQGERRLLQYDSPTDT